MDAPRPGLAAQACTERRLLSKSLVLMGQNDFPEPQERPLFDVRPPRCLSREYECTSDPRPLSQTRRGDAIIDRGALERQVAIQVTTSPLANVRSADYLLENPRSAMISPTQLADSIVLDPRSAVNCPGCNTTKSKKTRNL